MTNLPEAPASLNVYMLDPDGNKVQWTLRDASEDNLHTRYINLTLSLKGHGWRPLIPAPIAPAQPKPAAASEPVPFEGDEPADPSVEVMDVEAIERQVTPKGAVMFKVFCGRFTRHGVTAWPEVIEAAGMDPEKFKLGEKVAPSRHWSAHVQFEGDKPKKVVKLTNGH